MTRSFEKFSKRLEAVGLFDEVLDRALREHVTLRDLYEGPVRAPSIANARRKIYKWLMKEGKGLNEVARLFDRAPNGVWKLVGGNRKRK
jgi:hypothetical protein